MADPTGADPFLTDPQQTGVWNPLQVGTTQNAGLDVVTVTDPSVLQFLAESMADQLNNQSGGPVFTDLSDRIADIQIQTSAQGASILEVHVIDPTLRLLTLPAVADDPYSTFIQVADDGYLAPPIMVHFPPYAFKSEWQLCAVRAATMDPQSSEANVVLTFEDKIAAGLRQIDATVGGIKQSNPNESLEAFMARLVQAANRADGSLDIQALFMIDEQNDPNSVLAAGQQAAQQAMQVDSAAKNADAAAQAAVAQRRQALAQEAVQAALDLFAR